MPRRRQRTGFRFAIAHHAGYDQIGIVEDRAEGMAERVPQLTTLVDRPWAFRRRMAGNAAGKRKLRETVFAARPHPG